ncbi:carboxynorspermidine decarboxylase, partial [Thermoproteota archaeon]
CQGSPCLFKPCINGTGSNFGGGHHITRDDYDIEKLCALIINFKTKYNVDIILEPGEAVVLNAGVLTASVLDIVQNEKQIAILDTSAAAHMPDVLEMPYMPEIIGAIAQTLSTEKPNSFLYNYILAGNTCMSGDVIGEYSFESPLTIGRKLIFTDMALYTMVKTNTFNGINLPDIYLLDKSKELKRVRQFGYQDFKGRL